MRAVEPTDERATDDVMSDDDNTSYTKLDDDDEWLIMNDDDDTEYIWVWLLFCVTSPER